MKSEVFKIGDAFVSTTGDQYEVVSRSSGKAIVKFAETGYTTEVSKSSVKSGRIKDKLKPVVYGLGFYGDGSFTTSLDKAITAKALETWHSMFKRCYSEAVHIKHKPYSTCYVNPIWYDFQNFAKFYVLNPFRKAGWELDKDILVKGNKEYGPDKCTFVPTDINGYLKTNANRRGTLPIGVKLSYLKNSYEAKVRIFNGEQISLGKFDTVESAFEAYKFAKESVIKQKAEFWKNQICPKTYDALINCLVDIDD